MNQHTPFTEAGRREILDGYYSSLAKLQVAGQALDAADDDARAEIDGIYSHLRAAVGRRLAQYRDGLPRLPLSRCPFTGEEVRHSIDPFGLDGLWWRYEAPVRPNEELPRTYFALCGALELDTEVERTPFLCVPGPEAPYLVPRLLERGEIKAVVSSISVARHQAYPVFYFADPIPEMDRVNNWGANHYTRLDGRGLLWPVAAEPALHELDFELEGWIRAGKLLWIAPGDKNLALRGDVSLCPYLGLPGRRSRLCVQEGKVWTAADVPPPAAREKKPRKVAHERPSRD